MSENGKVVYVHDHSEAVLNSHRQRTAESSAAYLLPYIRHDMRILDIGCGPGTITIGLAQRVPQGEVIGVENLPEILEQARSIAAAEGVTNVKFELADLKALPYPDDSFDIVHSHQVLQHVDDPVSAFKEMRRVTKPGGYIATRETDFETMTWFPEVPGMRAAHDMYKKLAASRGCTPNAGRELKSWAIKAGFPAVNVACTAGTWCYSTPAVIQNFGSTWAERITGSSLGKGAIAGGFATQEELEDMAKAWREWSTKEDAWYGILHGEIVARK
ncbi:hypothetical protein CERSUDRAFT_84587 [Gelatoporia subvermispora B]|uniref:Methyltransferase domain-containing protein n=1 Tax=Ceriporiopsis subvermispora (strain B) TaxID=914234 RepID=M2PJR0_CERS8|nr:hypothetical protein CERSUDRAFT_84587 [Gelatoporia subvermispora B]